MKSKGEEEGKDKVEVMKESYKNQNRKEMRRKVDD